MDSNGGWSGTDPVLYALPTAVPDLAAMAGPPKPSVSVTAESPRSRQASAALYPVK